MSLPQTLTDMLSHLLSTYGGIKSWTIYEETGNNKHINVQIKFSSTDRQTRRNHGYPWTQVQPFQYKNRPMNEANIENFETNYDTKIDKQNSINTF